jgi:hypothetical protein
MSLSCAARPGLRFVALTLLVVATGASHGQGRFTISADGQEVTDATAGLTWRRCSEGMRWDGKACTGKLLKYTYAGAKDKATRTATEAGKPWRLPAREELVTLVDMKQKKKPRIDKEAFPQTPSALFWASRPGSTDDLNAYLVNFSNGKVRPSIGQSKFPVRLVRVGA